MTANKYDRDLDKTAANFVPLTPLSHLNRAKQLFPNHEAVVYGTFRKTYAEYRKGDKVAEYGLTALIAGGATYAAVKTGLLGVVITFVKKLWYLIVAGIAAIWGGIKRFFRRISGQEV